MIGDRADWMVKRLTAVRYQIKLRRMTANNQSLPPAAVVVRSRVADFDTWLAVFDSHEDARREAGILAHHINRAEDDPNDVSIFMALSDLEKAKAFAASDDLRERMQASGVVSAPEITYMTPVREAIVLGPRTPRVYAPSLGGRLRSLAQRLRRGPWTSRQRKGLWAKPRIGRSKIQRWRSSTTRPSPSTRCVPFLPMISSRRRCRRQGSRPLPRSSSSQAAGQSSTAEPRESPFWSLRI